MTGEILSNISINDWSCRSLLWVWCVAAGHKPEWYLGRIKRPYCKRCGYMLNKNNGKWEADKMAAIEYHRLYIEADRYSLEFEVAIIIERDKI